MGEMVDRTGPACQAQVTSHADDAKANQLSLVLGLLREAIDESGWKHDALAVALGLPRKTGAAYLSRMLSGEKAWTLRHLMALPDDIEARFAGKWASHRGAIVVEPLSGAAAVHALVGGLVGVLTQRLPAKADRMASAALPTAKRAAR